MTGLIIGLDALAFIIMLGVLNRSLMRIADACERIATRQEYQ